MKKRLLLLLLLTLAVGCAARSAEETPREPAKESERLTVSEPSVSAYHYEQLKEDLQPAYQTLLEGLKQQNERITLRNLAKAELESIYTAVRDDHPELFYLGSRYAYEVYTDGRIYLYPDYVYTAEEIGERQAQIEEQSAALLAQLPADADVRETARFLYAYVIEHAEYGSGTNDQNMDSFFIEGKTVCAGYARVYQYLMQQAGIPCVYVSGTLLASDLQEAYDTSAHAWNMVRLEGDWFYVDATSGDVTQYGPHTCYQYFLMASQEMERLYESEMSLPETKQPRQSYFYREGLYLSGYDEEVLLRAVERMKERGDAVLELRCAPEQLAEVKEELLRDDRIFTFLRGQGIRVRQLGCVEQPQLGSLEFYLNE